MDLSAGMNISPDKALVLETFLIMLLFYHSIKFCNNIFKFIKVLKENAVNIYTDLGVKYMSGGIQPISFMPILHSSKQIDEEHKRIIKKLQQYGISSTGDKEKDLQKLHVKELEEAKNVEKIDSKFLTINESEHRLILSKELSKNEDKLTEISNNPTLGQEILGQQVYQAIQMKKQKFKI